MNITQGVNYCLEYHKSNSKETTVRSWEFVLSRFENQFGDRSPTGSRNRANGVLDQDSHCISEIGGRCTARKNATPLPNEDKGRINPRILSQ